MKPQPECSLVFVYGSLKRGFQLHQHLLTSEFIAEARTEAIYFLVDCGDYPGLRHEVSSRPGVSILGEIFRVDAAALMVLDEVECVSEGLYRRERIRLKGAFEHHWIWAWFYASDEFDQRVIGDCWLV